MTIATSVQPDNSPRTPGLEAVRRLMARALPHRRVSGFERLEGGLCNTNLKVFLDSPAEAVVLRLYERDPSACGREAALLRLVRQTVPVPELLHADPAGAHGVEGVGPFAVLEYVDGVPFRQLKKTGDAEAVGQAAYSVGRTLAAIGRYRFPRPGQLFAAPRVDVGGDGGLVVAAAPIEGRDPIPRILDAYLASGNLLRRAGADLARRLHDFIWAWAPRLPQLDDGPEAVCSLVHSDLGGNNIILRRAAGRWEVATLLDWEFSFSGSPLIDVSHFLRFEQAARPLREPHFSRAFVEHGGRLPDDWRRLVRVMDLPGICESLTHDELPENALKELLGLIRATLEDRDPEVNI